MLNSLETSDLIVFSHLRWDFVFQRPQHLMIRHAKERRVFYMEEPVFGMTELPRLHLREDKNGVTVVVPYLPSTTEGDQVEVSLRQLVDELIEVEEIENFSVWYYTPMALSFTNHLKPAVTIFDCMDELSLFKGAPKALIDNESALLEKADLVFTGGHSLYQAKKHRHENIHPFPSSIDFNHFSKGRITWEEPEDQVDIIHPRVGFYGVIDERMDLQLLEEMADLRKDLQFVIIGPVVKIDPESLPKRSNIHYLGKKDYHELPLYLAGWDCAMMPFALNDSTRFISPTKTPEYLAAGKPVVSTSINDVINPYAAEKLVYIADTAEHFVDCIDKAMDEKKKNQNWLTKVDQFLDGNSWDETFQRMLSMEKEISDRRMKPEQMKKNYSTQPQTTNGMM